MLLCCSHRDSSSHCYISLAAMFSLPSFQDSRQRVKEFGLRSLGYGWGDSKDYTGQRFNVHTNVCQSCQGAPSDSAGWEEAQQFNFWLPFPVLAADGARTSHALNSKDLGREENLGLKTLASKGAFDKFPQSLLRDSLQYNSFWDK